MIKIKKIAQKIVEESLQIQKNEKVLITTHTNKSASLYLEISKKIVEKGAFVHVKIVDDFLQEQLINQLNPFSLEETLKNTWFEVDNYDTFITIEYNENDYNDIDSQKRKLLNQKLSYVNDKKTNQKKWLILLYPSSLDAYKAKMSTSKFLEFYQEVMTYDYTKMKKAILPLQKLMEKTNKVRITSPGTDLSFSIRNMNVVPCLGEYNLPDGEIFTAPIKESVEGYITYNTPSTYHGNVYHHVKLTFQKGKIIEASSDGDEDKLQEIFHQDEGSQYIGEFSLGLHPKILHPVGNILFDEKIRGSIHFTPGAAYKEAYNGNDSAIHWDLVLIQTKEYGGGEIYFDDVLIRKDGIFALEELKDLNFL